MGEKSTTHEIKEDVTKKTSVALRTSPWQNPVHTSGQFCACFLKNNISYLQFFFILEEKVKISV